MDATQIIKLAEAYSAHTALKLSTIGAYAVNDGKFFPRLSDGGECTLRTAKRVLSWFSTNWPDDLEWPRDIQRPVKRREVA